MKTSLTMEERNRRTRLLNMMKQPGGKLTPRIFCKWLDTNKPEIADKCFVCGRYAWSPYPKFLAAGRVTRYWLEWGLPEYSLVDGHPCCSDDCAYAYFTRPVNPQLSLPLFGEASL